MSDNTFVGGAGCQMWQHSAAAATPSFPTAIIGTPTTTHTSSLLFGARAVVLYKIIVTTGAAGVLNVGLADAAGSFTNIVLPDLDVTTDGIVWDFGPGIRITDPLSANMGVVTDSGAAVSVFYRRLI